ncbi:Gas vesicle structural protein [Frankia canadensis]|uniref:Gas vesicle structural protein n=2 Tax=Frankia canadensis TaxID=1836972 RepID=A0A2I2KN85_9ACTN|nr:gas vesicle protein [Frankia canadensis]SNQ47131.1 Gas vesicle structural protein [Frankia canadensis]SOU54421.1 Gas vesicle structural protein [Frankia canadensis]
MARPDIAATAANPAVRGSRGPMATASPSAPLRGWSGTRTDTLADVLERVLDKGVVIVGDVVVSVLDVELLTLKLRLFIASADTAREMGLDWWTTDPFYSSRAREAQSDDQRDQRDLPPESQGQVRARSPRELRAENARLRARLNALEAASDDDAAIPATGRAVAAEPAAPAADGERPAGAARAR